MESIWSYLGIGKEFLSFSRDSLFRYLGYEKKGGVFRRIGLFSSVVAVSMLVYGARHEHGGHKYLKQRKNYKIYMVGGGAHVVLSVALLFSDRSINPNLTGSLFTLGILLFSVPHYGYGLTGNKTFHNIIQYHIGEIFIVSASLCLLYNW
ncbi:uncharacterized protein LOC133176559 [Saccostrea echinata]|uniref:uncharacterized protein LOC133176559 n=1 Tax=Saccostrea echinata TaxID=191078 RepID=UPI002A7F4F67|nr:uncharacterized protein LOC133176559 [Saccostrea echinata]